MRSKGTITAWNDDKGFGFVTPRNGGDRLFLHASELNAGQRRPRGAETVSYEVALDRHQRPRAVNVRLEGVTHVSSPLTLAVIMAAGFLAGLFVLSRAQGLPLWIPGLYLAVSLLTALVYRIDKYRAVCGGWRTPEATLHFFALCGGWPGALIAQQSLRHKNRKRAFLSVFWGIVILHVSAWSWLLVHGTGAQDGARPTHWPVPYRAPR